MVRTRQSGRRQVDSKTKDDEKAKSSGNSSTNRSKSKSMSKYAMSKFPYHLPYKSLDLRKQPHLYRPGRGEQGVLMVEPYKGELLPFWAFKDANTATRSSKDLEGRFHDYIREGDFIGADMARKYIQMGFTRARRYANHTGGRKYAKSEDNSAGFSKRKAELPRSEVEDPVKAKSAAIFKEVLERIKGDERYIALRQQHAEKYEDIEIEDH